MSPAAALAPCTVPAESASDARWARWLPEWVRRIGAAVWVTAPDGRIVFVNERAERLLGVTAREAVGRACHTVVEGRTASGAHWCRAECPIARAADAGGEVPAVGLAVGEHWAEVTAIPVEGPDRAGRWIVHVAHVADRARRLERHAERVASRSEALREIEGSRERRPLSPRERQVLELLARDIEPSRVAAHLGISYVTVRNHVQHLLAKLGAHSVAEVVAMHVLAEE